VSKLLEVARKGKVIGSSLEARVVLRCKDKELYDFMDSAKKDLKLSLIVSDLEIVYDEAVEGNCENIKELYADIQHALGKKCDRCWSYNETVGLDAEHPDLCARCAKCL